MMPDGLDIQLILTREAFVLGQERGKLFLLGRKFTLTIPIFYSKLRQNRYLFLIQHGALT